MEQREAEELARTLEMWAALGTSGLAHFEAGDAAASMAMLQAAAALRKQAALIASLRVAIHGEKPATCC